jgi:hypothetical protein
VAATDKQVKIMFKEMSKNNNLSKAAAKADMCRQTAGKYYHENKLPSQLKKARDWQTRTCPFADVWPEIEDLLRSCPGLNGISILNVLNDKYDNRYTDNQLRTLQRKIRRWRALHDKNENYEVFFQQIHRPGEMAQTDFTETASLGLTILGNPYKYLLCQTVLPYSGWSHAIFCPSESMLSLQEGIQESFYRLGRVPTYHQTDNSTAATHSKGKDRVFNAEYLDLMDHLGMKPKVTAVGKKEQNGSVEARNGVLKRFLEQQLILRQSRDFKSEEEVKKWLYDCLQKPNKSKQQKLNEELSLMQELVVKRLPDYNESKVRVTKNATINSSNKVYTVPPRLIGFMVDVRTYKDKVEVYYSGQIIQSTPRLKGSVRHLIDYRHVIDSLVRKPGAFERYIYRDALFPSIIFRKAYDVLREVFDHHKADKTYLRILHFAATHSQSDTELALDIILSENHIPDYYSVRDLVVQKHPTLMPDIPEYIPNLNAYDALLAGVCA